MKNLKFSRLFAAMMFVACLVLVGCKPQSDDEGSAPAAVVLPENVRALTSEDGIVGKWGDAYPDYWAYDGYGCQYALNKVETASYGAHDSTVYIFETSETSGYLYYKFSKPISLYGIGEVDVTGKWGAIAYQNLTSTSVQMCDANYMDQKWANSLKDCVLQYTKENGYFTYISTSFQRISE